jgi:transposase
LPSSRYSGADSYFDFGIREGRLLRLEEWMDIRSLHHEGHSIKAIARYTGRSRNTVRRVLREAAPAAFHQPERHSQFDPYKSYLRERWQACGLSAVRLLPEIQAMGYTGSISTLRRYLHSLKPERERLRKLTVRFETPPGKQAQSDWAYCGRFPDPAGHIFPVYLFLMVLSFSRMLYVEFTSSMKLPTLLRCHQNAFQFFGGWTQQILYDNMKQVRLSPTELNPLFADFARHYGFTIDTCRIRRPRTKGKVERMVHYVKDAFLNGRARLGQGGRGFLGTGNRSSASVGPRGKHAPQEPASGEGISRIENLELADMGLR